MRLSSAVFALSFLAFSAGCGSQGTVVLPRPGPPPDPVAIQLVGEEDGTFEVTGLPDAILKALAEHNPTADDWAVLFHVNVAGTPRDVPPLLGQHRIEGGKILFRPRFPLRRGVPYVAVLESDLLPENIAGMIGGVMTPFTLPKPPTPPTVVTQVYPTRAVLPENQLKFYVHFSAPMSRQDVYDHVRLLDASGKEIPDVFVQVPEGLWDRAGRRATMILHPGRVKRGLKPREELGPILEQGKSYTLEIESKWLDGEGVPLQETFRKTFRVAAPDETQPDPKTWKLEPPAAGGRQPLAVTFPEPLDAALLHEVVWVVDDKGDPVEGTIELKDEETRWLFTPKEPWQAGPHRLVADTILEDLAANSIDHPFEVDVFKPVTQRVETKTVSLPFTVSAK